MTVKELIEKLTITIYLPVFQIEFVCDAWCLWQMQLIFWYCEEKGWRKAGGRNWQGCGRGKTKFLAILDYLKRGLR